MAEDSDTNRLSALELVAEVLLANELARLPEARAGAFLADLIAEENDLNARASLEALARRVSARASYMRAELARR